VLFLFSCHDEKEHTAPAIYPRDSVSVMTSYGVNTLISDSGVIKYKIVYRTLGSKSKQKSIKMDI
jgi:hypothetical protein